MENNNSWSTFEWHCANCGHIVAGFMDKNGKIKVECDKCRVVMIRTVKNRRHDFIDVYAPTDSN